MKSQKWTVIAMMQPRLSRQSDLITITKTT